MPLVEEKFTSRVCDFYEKLCTWLEEEDVEENVGIFGLSLAIANMSKAYGVDLENIVYIISELYEGAIDHGAIDHGIIV